MQDGTDQGFIHYQIPGQCARPASACASANLVHGHQLHLSKQYFLQGQSAEPLLPAVLQPAEQVPVLENIARDKNPVVTNNVIAGRAEPITTEPIRAG